MAKTFTTENPWNGKVTWEFERYEGPYYNTSQEADDAATQYILANYESTKNKLVSTTKVRRKGWIIEIYRKA